MSTEEQDWDELMGITNQRDEMIGTIRQLIDWTYTARPTDTDQFMGPSPDDADRLASYITNQIETNGAINCQEIVLNVVRVVETNDEVAIGQVAMEIRRVMNIMYMDMLVEAIMETECANVKFHNVDVKFYRDHDGKNLLKKLDEIDGSKSGWEE
jgi:hypothetical protein